jgi:peptidoglycan/xylan/chitin deacetylase (PgdA/CDA1 family)
VRHRVTLSFDNGPTPRVTPWVLDVLGERGVRSTFFVVGQQLRIPGTAAIARRAVAEGHWIGNHTLTHSVPLGELDDLAVDREIASTQELIGDLSHPDRLFRPFGRGGIIDDRLLGHHALRRL